MIAEAGPHAGWVNSIGGLIAASHGSAALNPSLRVDPLERSFSAPVEKERFFFAQACPPSTTMLNNPRRQPMPPGRLGGQACPSLS